MKSVVMDLKKWIIMIRFREKYPAAKAPPASGSIFFISSRHVEADVKLEKQ